MGVTPDRSSAAPARYSGPILERDTAGVPVALHGPDSPALLKQVRLVGLPQGRESALRSQVLHGRRCALCEVGGQVPLGLGAGAACPFTRARSRAEVDSLKLSRTAADTSWRAAAWFFERTRPERYGVRQSVNLAGSPDAPVEVRTITVDDLEAKIQMLRQQEGL